MRTGSIQKGDVALACRHIEREGPFQDQHVYSLRTKGSPGAEIAATPQGHDDAGGKVIYAQWLLVCDDCNNANPISMARHHFVVLRDVPVRKASIQNPN